MPVNSIVECLKSKNPLSREIVEFLVDYKEEDAQVDYKESFDPSNQKCWLELAKDISAFANTHGGYLVFGVRDSDKKVVGISGEARKILGDSSNILQKINRNFEPEFANIRTKAFRFDGKMILVLLSPVSAGKTHVVSNEGKFKFESGTEKVLLRKGTFYVRRSGGNHLADSRDFDTLVERRIDQFRESLFDKVARVIKAPATTDVYLLAKDKDESAKRFVLEDSSDAVAVKGITFTIPPEGTEQEVAAWNVIYKGDSRSIPPSHLLWGWYNDRDNIELPETQLLTLFQFSLWLDAPPFYWIRNLRTQEIQKKLMESIAHRPPSTILTPMLMVASFLGKSTYSKALRSLSSVHNRIQPALKTFPNPNPREIFCRFKLTTRQTEAQLRKKKLERLNLIAKAVVDSKNEPSVMRRNEARKIDCFLYARDDKYQSKIV